MKTKIYITWLAMAAIPLSAQNIGINTSSPQASLDINGTVKIRATPSAPSLPGYQLLAVNQNTGGDFQVAQVNPQLIVNSAISQINATTGVSTSVYAARKTSGTTLIDLGVLPNGFRPVNFVNAERTLGTTAVFSDTDNAYVVPSNGVYNVRFSFRYGFGILSSVLPDSTGVAVLRNRVGTYTLIDAKSFDGITINSQQITLSNETADNDFTFQAGDRISFGITNASVLDPGLTGASQTSFHVYKVSN